MNTDSYKIHNYFPKPTYIERLRLRLSVKLMPKLMTHLPNPATMARLGLVHAHLGDYDKAARCLKESLQQNPNQPETQFFYGLILEDLSKTKEALQRYSKAISLRPTYEDAVTYRQRLVEKINSQTASSPKKGKPRPAKNKGAHAQKHAIKGGEFYVAGKFHEALASWDKAIALKPDFAESYHNRSLVLRDLKRLDESLASCDKAIALKPDLAEAYHNRSLVLRDLKRLDESLASCDKAIALKPDLAEAYHNRGVVLLDLKRLDESLASCDKAITINPNFAEAYYNRSLVLRDLKRPDESLASCDKAIALKPNFAEAYDNRGNALLDLQRLDEALVSFDKALALKPDLESVANIRFHVRMKLCDWEGFSKDIEDLVKGIQKGNAVADPFALLGLIDSPSLQLKSSQIYADRKFKKQEALGPILRRVTKDKIRIGYYSADFKNHPVSFLIAELLEQHDRSKFDVYGFSFGREPSDDMRRRVAAGVDRFIDVREMSDLEVARLSRELGVDIAVDLGGYTQDSRTGIFAARAAPIQVSYLGYIGTMGANYIDYIIADKSVIPVENQTDFTEKVAYLPNSYQVNNSKRKISDRQFSKQELGLPEDGFVFCCFNQSYKISPATFDGWMRILKAVNGSMLWLLENSPTTEANLGKEAEKRGVDSNRLVFAPRIPYEDYLARYRFAGLMLDTLPYNAGTTASDALWAGLPVLTCMGKSFVSRMASSLLNAIELPELVTHTQEGYEAKAIELATHPDKLQKIQNKLYQKRLTAPLFDGKTFAKNLEAAYEAMYAQYQAGAPPDVIEVTRF